MSLSIVIPVYNEVESLPILHQRIHAALDGIPADWEIIYVDDGSQDGSVELLRELAAGDRTHTSVILFRRNFGQTAAMAAGFEHARGDVVVPMDADLQNDPADIPMLVAKMDEGYEVVSGWRKARQDDIVRKIPSRIANGIISRITGVALHDYGCTLKAFRRDIIQSFRLYGEMHRFIPVYARAAGARIAEVPVQHHARQYGQAKYGLGRTLKVIMDLFTVRLLTGFATKPMYLFGRPGLYMMGLGLLAAVASPFLGWGFGTASVFWPLLTIGILLLAMGFQCLLLGGLAELMMRTYFESQDKRPYVITDLMQAQWDTVGASEARNAK
ncbi:MAG: glycosyltransferase family 2 protein [Armatimonadota bacterium]